MLHNSFGSSTDPSRGQPSAGEPLSLPDWSGQLAQRRRIPVDRWLAYCRSNLVRLRAHPGFGKLRERERVDAEFSL
jgi:hypothetical protein